jgi:hypothetical protein
MGVLVDLTERLTLSRRLRGLLRESQCRSIVNTRRYIEAIELEIRNQEVLLCSSLTSMEQVEEAIAGLELLAELLTQRKRYLAALESDYFDTRVGE